MIAGPVHGAPVTGPAGLSRRACLQHLGAASAALALGAVPEPLWGQASGRPPNVVLIVADDLGSTDLGCYGAADLPTPHLDALAASGVRFTQHYVTAPACTPSRASLLTGREYLRCLKGGLGMEAEEVTLAEILRGAGYRTAIFGKWHLGSPEAVDPLSQGFDEFMGFKVGAIDNYTHEYRWGANPGHRLQLNRSVLRAGGSYFPELVTRAGEAFVDGAADRPFFLYLPYNLPHYPLQAPPDSEAAVAHIADPARRAYAACVHALDARVGRILARLEAHDLTRDTIVLVLSDHGHSTEADAGGGGGSAGPYRGHKGMLLEGGIRVPCLAAWPGHFPAGVTRGQMTSTMDWLPTLAAYAGVSLEGGPILDGRGLDAVIRTNASSPHASLCWIWQERWAVREGPWKLVGDALRSVSLYNLRDDPGESRDRAPSERDVVRRLAEVHDAWANRLRSDPSVIREYRL